MAVPTLTFEAGTPGDYTIGSDAKDAIIALRTLLVSEAPTGVTITDYSATEAHIELSFTGLTGFDTDARVLIFGGQTPNAGALNGGSASNTSVYVLCAKSAGTTGPDQSYTVGNPYNSSDPNNTLGVIGGNSTLSTVDKVRFFTCEEGIVVVYYDNNNTNGFCFYAGALGVRTDGDTRRYLAGGSGTVAISSTFWNASGSGNPITTAESPGSIDGMISAISEEGSTNTNAYRMEKFSSAGNIQDYAGTSGFFKAITLLSNDDNFAVGNLRQIYIGTKAQLGQTATITGTSATAFAVNGNTSAAADAFWLGNS